MERISDHWRNMGVRISIFRWWQHAGSIQRSTSALKTPKGIKMSYPYPYHLLPFKTYQEWLDTDWKSLIHCVRDLQNQCVYLESSYATPYQQYDNMLDFLSDDCIRQINDIWHELLDIRLALLCNKELSTLLQLQWNGSTKSNLWSCSLFSPL